MNKQVLVVDDEEPIQRLLSRILDSAGYTVFCASNADDALSLLEKHTIYISVLDIQLPGKDGLELCRMIRADRPMDYLIAMTGHASLYDLVQCRGAGFDDYFTKPFEPDQLLHCIAEAASRVERWKGMITKKT